MSRNDQVLVGQIIKEEFHNNDTYSKEDDFFEFFSALQILKDYDLTYDQIESGLCGTSLDGGADSIYLLVNGDLISGDEDVVEKYKKNVDIELVIIQSKNEKGFGEEPILKLSRLSSNLLDLEFDINDFKGRYNESVLGKFEVFRKTYISLITKRPNLKIKYFYVSKGYEIHPNVISQSKELEKTVSSILTDSDVAFYFITASNLLDIYRKRDNSVFSLKLSETPLSSQGKVFISLVKLNDYYDFITDQSGNIIKHIFESNVRDYQGKTSVNQEIKSTLENRTLKEDFWWLNNGVTILATDVSAPGGKELIIHNPEIVNGLQTSNEIFLHFHNNNGASLETIGNRSLLVRVIVPENEVSRDNIIRATNSQTPIPKASLRATDSIHRNIEDYFKPRGLFYDRRKNFYKNEGKKPVDIVGLPFLAQCLMAITLFKPDTARARPSTLLEDDASYEKLYSESNNIHAYYIAAVIGKESEKYLKARQELSISDKNNLRFYLAFVIAALVTKNKYPGFRALENIKNTDIDTELMNRAFVFLSDKYNNLGGGDKLAKGGLLIKEIMKSIDEILN